MDKGDSMVYICVKKVQYNILKCLKAFAVHHTIVELVEGPFVALGVQQVC